MIDLDSTCLAPTHTAISGMPYAAGLWPKYLRWAWRCASTENPAECTIAARWTMNPDEYLDERTGELDGCSWDLCSRCARDPQPMGFGSPRRCAFPAGVFSTDNWSCASLDLLRAHVDRGEEERNGVKVVHTETDQRAGIMPFLDGTVLVLGMYKHRGRTEAAVVIDGPIARPLTLAEVDRWVREELNR